MLRKEKNGGSWRSNAGEDADARRVQHRRAEHDVGKRILGVLARAAAAREERLQRLRRELDDPVAVDAPGPSPLEIGLLRAEHAESHGSVWTITSAISGCARRMSSSISLARAWASSRRLWPSRPSVRNATRPTSVRRKRSSRGALPGRLAHDPLDRGRVERLLLPGRRLGERLEVRLHRVDLGRRGADRLLDLLGHLVRGLERHLARQLEVQRQLEAAGDVDERKVVDLAHARHRQRRRVRALADARVLERLDVDDDVTAGQRALDRALDRVGDGVPLADGRDRGDADHHVGELASARLAHPQPSQLHCGGDLHDRRERRGLGGVRGAVHEHVDVVLDQAPRCGEHHRGDEERSDRVAVRIPGACEEQADEHGERPGQVAAEVKRVRGERGTVVSPRPRHDTVVRLMSIAITSSATASTHHVTSTVWVPEPVRRSIARQPMKMLASPRNDASASAARCSALPCPY